VTPKRGANEEAAPSRLRPRSLAWLRRTFNRHQEPLSPWRLRLWGRGRLLWIISPLTIAILSLTLGNGIRDQDFDRLQELLNSVPASGATIRLAAQRYVLNSPLRLQSNTRLVCSPGAALVAARLWGNGAHKFLLENQNHEAHSITDHDLAVEGCRFDMSDQDRGDFHAINFRMARDVRISQVHCVKGGDCAAMMATDNTLIEDSDAIGIRNACWDHWEGPTRGIIRGGYCETVGGASGIFVTGGGWGPGTTGRGQRASRFLIQGGTYNILDKGLGIWIMGLGKPGDDNGASYIQVTDTLIQLGREAHPCFKISGVGTDISVTNFTCKGGNGPAFYVGGGGDSGAPSNVAIANGLIDSATMTVGTGLIKVDSGAKGVSISNVRATNSSGYLYAIDMADDTTSVAGNTIPGGSLGMYMVRRRLSGREAR
jgi:hypothetical protein